MKLLKFHWKHNKRLLKNAQESFNLGAMSIFDFDLVRNRFVNAQSTLIRNKFDFVFKNKGASVLLRRIKLRLIQRSNMNYDVLTQYTEIFYDVFL